MPSPDDILRRYRPRARLASSTEIYLNKADAVELTEQCYADDLAICALEAGYVEDDSFRADTGLIYGFSIQSRPESVWLEVREACHRDALDFLANLPDRDDLVVTPFIMSEETWRRWKEEAENK